MIFSGEEERLEPVVTVSSVLAALAFHALLFLVIFLLSLPFKEKLTVVPMDLTVVVNENLDGVDNEPPPLDDPPPPPPKPVVAPTPKPVVEPPPVVEQEAVEKVVEKKPPKKPIKKKQEEKKPEKQPEKQPEEKPKKQIREERLADMRRSTKPVKNPIRRQPSADGRTGRQRLTDAEIRRLLELGYKPGVTEQVAPDDLTRCISLIQRAINDRWNAMRPKVGREGYVEISVKLTSGGRLTDCRLAKSCGDPQSDRAALEVANAVGTVRGLSPEFLRQFSKDRLTLRYKVENR